MSCPACGWGSLEVAGDGSRVVCTHCGRCWDGTTEVDTLACPGCDQRVVCECRPTPLVDALSSVHELHDGTRILVRPLLYSDRYVLADAYRHLSLESRRLRFFSAPDELGPEDLEYLTNIDYRSHFAWAAFALDVPGCPGVGVARYVREPARREHAELAVTVLDAYQGRGLGTLLVTLLADRARQCGITTFVSYILWDNEEVLDALGERGARISADEPGVARVEVDIPSAEEPSRLSGIGAALRHLMSGPSPRITSRVLEVQ